MSTPTVKIEDDAKPAPPEQFVTPVVTDGEGRRLTRTLRPTDKLKVLMDFYHEMVPTVKRVDTVFLHHRRRIRGWQTPEEHGMKDGDLIQVLSYFTPDTLVTPVVQDFGGRAFTRTMRRTDRMQGLMDFYAAMVPTSAGDGDGGVFLYCGQRVSGEQTPAGLGMKDRDRVYFVPGRRSEVVEENSEVYITLKVRDMQGRTVERTMRMTEKVEVMMDLYRSALADKRNWAFMFDGSFRFEGLQLWAEKTPAELKMEDGDEVDYFPVLI
jgi:small ubiquitin-related modifier